MVDIFTPEKRSWVMSRIRSRDTKIEKKIAHLLRKNKIHYRRFPRIFGNPDFVVEKKCWSSVMGTSGTDTDMTKRKGHRKSSGATR